MEYGSELNTANDFMVGVRGDSVVVMLDPSRRPLTPDVAIRLAAHLVAMAETIKMLQGQQFGPTFVDYVNAIKET